MAEEGRKSGRGASKIAAVDIHRGRFRPYPGELPMFRNPKRCKVQAAQRKKSQRFKLHHLNMKPH